MSSHQIFFALLASCMLGHSVYANPPVKPETAIAIQAPATKVNINQAKAKTLTMVQGLNPASARSIVAYRKRHGEFKTLDDMAKVRALHKLSPAELKVIQDQVSV